jgi:hypothetical protein
VRVIVVLEEGGADVVLKDCGGGGWHVVLY